MPFGDHTATEAWGLIVVWSPKVGGSGNVRKRLGSSMVDSTKADWSGRLVVKLVKRAQFAAALAIALFMGMILIPVVFDQSRSEWLRFATAFVFGWIATLVIEPVIRYIRDLWRHDS